MTWRRPHKFNAVATVYNGVRYASKAEAEFARTLDLRLRARPPDKVASWRSQVRIPLMVNGVKICTYVVDFEITYSDGSIELVEIKGFQTPEFKLKRKLFEATWLKENPHVRYSINP